MIEHRRVTEMGGGNFGWLKAIHHFYVGGPGNQQHQPLGNLYVWNDDEIAPGAGFPAHFHKDVEIITYVREGTVWHKDSTGGTGQIDAGDVQVMSAGTGIEHAELSGSGQTTRIFQIWLSPREKGGTPAWGTKKFPKNDRAGRFVVLASGDESDTDAVAIRADARISGATLAAGETLVYPLSEGRKAYIVPAFGQIAVNDTVIDARDGVAVQGEPCVRIHAISDTEIVLADVV